MNPEDDEIDGCLEDALKGMADHAPAPPSASDLDRRLDRRAARRTSAIVALAAAAAAAVILSMQLLGVFGSGGPGMPAGIDSDGTGGGPLVIARESPAPSAAPLPAQALPQPIEIGSGRLEVESILKMRLLDRGVESGIIERNPGESMSLAVVSAREIDMAGLESEFDALFRNYACFRVRILGRNLAFSMVAR